jgi:hypothetical protein
LVYKQLPIFGFPTPKSWGHPAPDFLRVYSCRQQKVKTNPNPPTKWKFDTQALFPGGIYTDTIFYYIGLHRSAPPGRKS